MFCGMLAVATATGFLIVRPVVRSTRKLAGAYGKTVSRRIPAATYVNRHFRPAWEQDPLDPTPHVECARWLLTSALATIDQDAAPSTTADEVFTLAAESLAQAVRRDPFNVRLPRMQMQLYSAWAKRRGDSRHYLAAVDAAHAALRLYPQDPVGLLALADCQAKAAGAMGSRELLAKALETYGRALALDDARPPWESIRRLKQTRRAEINAEINRISEALAAQP